MGTFIPQDANGVLISDPSKGTQTNDVKVTLDSETVTVTGAVTTSGTVTEANSSAIKTAVELIDNCISGSEAQVDVVTMPAITGTVTANAGTDLNTSALALDATLTGGTAKAIVRGAAKGTTAAADATVTAAGANNAGLDVVIRDATGAELDLRTENENWNAADHGVLMFGRDTESTPNKYRAINLSAEGDVECNLSDINGAEPNVGSGAASTGTLRVIAATDSPDVTALQIIDNFISGSRGLVTEDNSGSIKTAVEIMDDWDESDRAKVNVVVGQAGITAGAGAVAANTPRVTHASDDPAVTALQLIDNCISGSEAQVDIVAALPAGTNAIGALVPSDKDVTTHTNIARKYYTNAGAVTDGIVWSPAAGKRWHITSLYFQTSADATVTFEDDKSGGDDPVLKGEYKAGSGLSITFDPLYPMASGEDAADLIVTTSAGNIYITVVGYEV